MSLECTNQISRRRTLQWLAAAIATSGATSSGYAGAAIIMSYAPTKNGYGPDPDMTKATFPWDRIMTQDQLRVAAVLADLILPETERAPAPSAIGVHEFVDEWISAPYPVQQSDRQVILTGLTSVEDEALRRWEKKFLEASHDDQSRLVEDLATEPSRVPGAPAPFFKRLRYLVVGAYYTTAEGFKDMGYVGNVALESYPAPTEREVAILESELRKLGL